MNNLKPFKGFATALNDPLYMDLMALAEKCSEDHKGGCEHCSISEICERWVSHYSEISSDHNLKSDEQAQAIIDFNKLAIRQTVNWGKLKDS